MNISQEKREKMLMLLSKIKEEKKEDKDVVIALNEIENEIKNMKYGLMWEEHEEEVDKELENNIPIFSEEKDKEILVDEKGKFNFLLEGDNLHSLKLLQRTHKEKIDIIYIDPPYNTKNKDFIYDDNMIGEDDGYRHSKWLSFMQRRLEIAKDLLTDDGVIFISIDDNEQAQLKLLCDNIFGESNFIANFKWNKTATPPSLSNKVRNKYEYILCYEKIRNNKVYNGGVIEGGDMPLLNTGNNERTIKFKKESVKFFFDGKIKKGKHNKVEVIEDIIVENGQATNDFELKGEFKWTQKTIDEEIKNGTTFVIKSKNISPRYIREGIRIKKPADIISKIECLVDTNEFAKKELEELVPNNNMSYPKPSTLIRFLVSLVSNKDSIILDFFAGSGTTGHAVAKLNAEDGGNRTYILCTNNENNICEEVTYKRLLGIQKELPHNLKYFKTDFLEKSNEELLYDLMEHMYEMIVLENGYSKESKKYAVILTDEDMDELEEHILEYTNLERIYMSNEVLLTSKQNNILSNYEIKYIPQYYFDNELKEMGEFW